jgi:hypothetical protein
MTLVRPCRSVLMLMLGLMLLLAWASLAQAQKKSDATVAALSGAVVDDNANLDLEIYLLAASDAPVEGSRLPGLLEPVVRQLRATLPFASYRLSATMMNRMKNGGRLEVSGVGATPFAKVTAPAPLFSEYSVSSVKLKSDAATGQNLVEILDFRFGARVPIQTGAAAGGGSAPVIQYQNTGIRTEFSMREGEPVIVGTLNVGQSGEAFILVVSAKRTGQR